MRCLLIFIKNPQLGKAKTRVAATAGEEKALAIYLRLLDHTRKLAQKIEVHRQLYYSDFVPDTDEWPDGLFEKKVQEGKGLGERMARAFEGAFQKFQRVVIIGSDCPYLDEGVVNRAFEVLEEADFVIGPATDGGYYLLGMRRFEAALFVNMEWSTERVLEQTVATIYGLGKSLVQLPQLTDIDTEDDWLEYEGVPRLREMEKGNTTTPGQGKISNSRQQ